MEFANALSVAALVVAIVSLAVASVLGVLSRRTAREANRIAADAFAEAKRSTASEAAIAAEDREAGTRADVHPLHYRQTVAWTPGDDQRGMHVKNEGPAVARNVWAEYARTSDSKVVRAAQRDRLSPDEIAFFRGGPLVARPPDLPSDEEQVAARCHWTDEGGEQSTDWGLYPKV